MSENVKISCEQKLWKRIKQKFWAWILTKFVKPHNKGANRVFPLPQIWYRDLIVIVIFHQIWYCDHDFFMISPWFLREEKPWEYRGVCLIFKWLGILFGTFQYWTMLYHILQYYLRFPNIVQYIQILSQYSHILSSILQYCSRNYFNFFL